MTSLPESLFDADYPGLFHAPPEERQPHDRLRHRSFHKRKLHCASAKFYALRNNAIPCRDGCPIQVIPARPSAKILSHGNPGRPYLYILRMEEAGRFRDTTSIRIRQPDRTGGAALPVAYQIGRDQRLCCEFCSLAFPSPVYTRMQEPQRFRDATLVRIRQP